MFRWFHPIRSGRQVASPPVRRPSSRAFGIESLERRELMASVALPTPIYSNGVLTNLPKVINNVQVSSVYWGKDFEPGSYGTPTLQPGSPIFNAGMNMQALDTFMGTLVSSSYMDLLNQYGAYRGTFVGRDVAANGLPDYQANGTPTTVNETQITNMLRGEISAGKLAVTSNSLFVVVLPPGMQSNYDVTNGFSGHHQVSTDSKGNQFFYAVIPNPIGNGKPGGSFGSETNFQYQTEVVSHELAEAVTNPDFQNGWMVRTYDSSTPTVKLKDEIGDIPQATKVNCEGWFNGYLVQMEWSNKDKASVMPVSGNANWKSNGPGWVSQITSLTDNKTGQGMVFGIGGDKGVYLATQQTDGSWSAWQNLGKPGGSLGSGATSIITAADAEGWRVFAIGPNGAAYTRGVQNASWTWLGGNCKQLASWTGANGNLELFAVGTNDRIYEMTATGPGSAGFVGQYFNPVHPRNDAYSFDVTVKSIAIGQNANGKQELFGISTWYNDVWTLEQTTANGSWGEWRGLNGWVSQISVGMTSDNRMELFGIGGNQALYVMRQTSPDVFVANTWYYLGGGVKEFAVGRNEDGREEVIARGTNDYVYALKQTATNDAWIDSTWFQIGGPVKGIAVVSNRNYLGSSVYGTLTVAAINATDNSLSMATQTKKNGGWY